MPLVLMLLTGSAAFNSHAKEDKSVLMIAGQSREEFSSYINKVCGKGKHCQLPAGATFYTSLAMTGFESPHANAPGDHHQDLWYLTHTYQPLEIQIGLWLSAGQLAAIDAGRYSENIDRLAKKLGRLNRTVYLRIGYEFDGPHNRYKPADFIKAYRRIADRMRREKNVRLVWHSYAMNPTYQGHDVMEWYPGDDYVDWLAVSFFQAGEDGYHAGPNRARILQIAREKAKPVMVAEASAIRYTAKQKKLTGVDYWNYWYKPFFTFIEENDEIKAVSMINVNWDSQQQHAILEWGDARIEADPYVLTHWRKKMQEKYWLFSAGKNQ